MFKSKLFSLLLVLLSLHVAVIRAQVGNMVCFYDSHSFQRQGSDRMSLEDLSPALHFCNYLVYGYAAIDPVTYELKPMLPYVDIQMGHYKSVASMKKQFPALRVLLSVGGDRDYEGTENHAENNKYMRLLEDPQHRQNFVNSAYRLVTENGFDGLDLAWQFPKNPPREVVGGLRGAWLKLKGWFRGPKPVDPKADDHKAQFTSLVREMNTAFRQGALFMTLTMMPNVNPEMFIDIFVVTANVEFVNLGTYDFQTPTRDPKLADYPAPLYEMYERCPEHNINYQVDYWLNNTAPANRINIGVPAYGLAWAMSKKSGITGYPPIAKTLGVYNAGNGTNTTASDLDSLGIQSWPRICQKLVTDNEKFRLRKVGDPTKRYSNYAYRAAEEDEQTHEWRDGLWVGYDGPEFAAHKAGYANARGLGGVALFDLSLDDFRGVCAGEKYPILRSIKHRL